MYHIIIAEDNPDIQELYRWMFTDSYPSDFEIIANGSDVITKIDQRVPDLLILDINLPESSGLNVLKHARLKRGLSSDQMKVIVVTANHVARMSPEIDLADCYIEKPFSCKALLAEVESLLAAPKPA